MKPRWMLLALVVAGAAQAQEPGDPIAVPPAPATTPGLVPVEPVTPPPVPRLRLDTQLHSLAPPPVPAVPAAPAAPAPGDQVIPPGARQSIVAPRSAPGPQPEPQSPAE